ncbi:disks large-associated protein 5-like [Pseudophryne corroboree]|uniref:disks large-associated protein 5-like n=1 Tax=Pseudophryne corroboree TaxID=495146 RepID=UPI003081376C
MDNQSPYAGLYKKNSSVDHIREKVAQRKSITQKENRHREFRKSRGLLLADVNIPPVKEQVLPVVDEAKESGHGRTEIKPADNVKARDRKINERLAMLQRFKEEKQQRKLKEQQEKAKKGVFKCGIYKAENPFIPVIASQNAVKVKQKEKVAVRKASTDRTLTRGHGQSSSVKRNETENKVSGVLPATSTRSSAGTSTKHSITTRTTVMASRLSTAAKAPLKNTAAAAKSQTKTTKEIKEDIFEDQTEHPVDDQLNNDLLEETVAVKDTAADSVPMETSSLVRERKPSFSPDKDAAAETVPMAETSPFVRERKPCFAPDNLVFQPLHGMCALTFPPLTPDRTNSFLAPSCTWSPMASKSQFVFTRGHHTEEHKACQVSPPELLIKATDVTQGTDILSSSPVKECTGDGSSAVAAVAPVTHPSCEPILHFTDNKSAQPEELQRDVPYFRDFLKSENQRLKFLCSEWDKKVDMDIPEDAKDLIRTAVGQTRLLLNERFKQFEGLVDHCEFKTGEKETTCTDLEGFWDMIYLQKENVYKKFSDLKKLEESSWQQSAVQTKKVVKKKIALAAKQRQGDNCSAAAKDRLAVVKSALKNKSKTQQVYTVLFDAGFFRIESPAKRPSSHRKLDRSSSQASNIPKSAKKVLQYSGNPVINVEDLQAQKSPSHVKSPLRKALFGADASLQNQETNTMYITPDPTASDAVPQVVDMTKYLVPVGTNEVRSHGVSLQEWGLQEDHTSASPLADDVFTGSSEKAVPSTRSAGLVGSPKPGPDEAVGTTNSPLSFLGSCTPTTVEK